MAGEGAGGELAGDVHRIVDRLLDGRRLKLDRAARRADAARNVDEPLAVGGLRGGRHRDLHEAVAMDVERHRFARAKADLAERNPDHPGIRDRAADQPDEAALAGRNPAGVADRRGMAIAPEPALAVHEVAVVGSERRADETAPDIDDSGLGDRYAVRIDEIELAVGVEPPGDARGRIARHAVEGGRTRIRLMVGDAVGLADRKGVPVDDGVLRPLIDRQTIVRGSADGRMARGDRAALRQDAGAPSKGGLKGAEGQRCSGGKRERAAQKVARQGALGFHGPKPINHVDEIRAELAIGKPPSRGGLAANSGFNDRANSRPLPFFSRISKMAL